MIIGIDLGENLGVAFGDGGPPECETDHLPRPDGAWALRVEGRIRSFFREGPVSGIAYEAPYPALGKKWRQSGQAHLIRHLTLQFGQKVLIEKVCCEYGITPSRIPVNAARKLVVGKGFPTEDEILEAVRALGARASTHHEADAAVIYFAAQKGLIA